MAPLMVTVLVTLFSVLHLSTGSPVETNNFIPFPGTLSVDLPEEIPPTENELDDLANILTELLIQDPWEDLGEPLVYVSGPADNEEGMMPIPLKRSRYYRRYPWKRQNGRNYDPDGYICNPSKDDIFQLLVALHDAKNGKDRTVHFCNRRRPARAIFTNIRFLGRRK